MPSNDPSSRAALRFGWTALVVFALLGLTLEGLHLIKWPLYFEVQIRRELWTLAHAHGALLALITIVFGLYAENGIDNVQSRRRASQSLRGAALLMPAGFFLGGIANPETDPSIAIVLVPVGAVLLLYAIAITALASWRKPDGTSATLSTESDADPGATTRKARTRRRR